MSNLLFHQAALGDFVLTLPLLRALGPEVAVVSHWSHAELAKEVMPAAGVTVRPWSIELFEFTRLHAQGGPTALSPAVRELFEGATRIVSFVSPGDDAWAASVARLAPNAQRLFVRPRPPQDATIHVTRWHRDQLAKQGFEYAVEPLRSVGGDPAGPVLVHPGSGGMAKCWPLERFEALMEAMIDLGRTVAPILGPVEAETWPSATLDRWSTRYSAALCPAVKDLAGAFARASCYIGNDSGPTHLAAMVGLPTVALFGPTDPKVWSPLGARVAVLAPPEPQGMDWLEVDRVVAACGVGR